MADGTQPIYKRLVETGYGILEKNAVVYPRTGNIMAMFEVDSNINAENGMLLGIDYKSEKIVAPASGDVIALVDSCEKEYYDEVRGLRTYALGNGAQNFKPRMGILSVNDRFTTSTVTYDSAVYANLAAIKTAIGTGLYGIAHTDGTILLTADNTAIAAAKVVLKAEKATKLANGDDAIKFAVIKAN